MLYFVFDTLFLFIRTSNFGAEAERSYFFSDNLRLKLNQKTYQGACCSLGFVYSHTLLIHNKKMGKLKTPGIYVLSTFF